MSKWPTTKEGYSDLGFTAMVVYDKGGNPPIFHKMEADDWKLERAKHVIPLMTAEEAFEAYKEGTGAIPCKKCFPSRKVKDGDDAG